MKDPAILLDAIAEWLLGYRSHGTRRTYAAVLGLPVSGNDFAAWTSSAPEPDGWAASRERYALALTIPPPRLVITNLPPREGFRTLHYFRWLVAHEIDPLAVRSAQVKEWLGELADAGAAPSTRDGMRAAAKTLYEHLADAGLVDANPISGNRRRLGLDTTQNTSPTIVLTTAQVRALLRCAGTRRNGQGNLTAARALTVVALFTLGLRVSEVCGLNRVDLHVTRGRRALRVHGKGGKERVVYLSGLADDALSAYLTLLDATAGSIVTSLRTDPRATSPLVVGRTGHRATRGLLWELLRRTAAAGGEELQQVAAAMHPHAMRHFYVTAAHEAGANDSDTAEDVGHSSSDTTRRVYNHAARDPARSAVDTVADAILHT